MSENQPLLENNDIDLKRFRNSRKSSKSLIKIPLSKFSRFSSRKRYKDESVVTKKQTDIANTYSWWTKFYNSQHFIKDHDHSQKHGLKIYNSELENQPEFNGFYDWAEPIDILKRMSSKKSSEFKDIAYAQLKCCIEVRKWSGTNLNEASNYK